MSYLIYVGILVYKSKTFSLQRIVFENSRKESREETVSLDITI